MPDTERKPPKGYTGQCNPEVWDERAKPPQPKEKKIGQITEEQVDEYFREGVVLIEDYFTKDELEPIKKDIEMMVGTLADRLFAEDKVKSKYEEYGAYQRLTLLNKDFPGAGILIHKLGLMPKSVRDLWAGDKLCNAVEQLIGANIGGHPVWNLRSKLPQDEASTVPWHQDCAYLDTNSYDKHQACAWIPLLDATPTNGCLEFAMRGHKNGKIAEHTCCQGDTWYVMLEQEDMRDSLDVDIEKDLKVIPVKYGSMLLFNNCIPHRSLNNLSGFPGEIRWSLDLRWQDPKLNYAFHGLKDGMTFRKADDPKWRPSWNEWYDFLGIENITPNRDEMKDEEILALLKDTFSTNTAIHGPWMKNWEIHHANRHTDELLKDPDNLTWH